MSCENLRLNVTAPCWRALLPSPRREFADEVLTYSPSCSATAALEAIPYVSRTVFAAHLKHSRPSKSGESQRINNYLLHLAPEPMKTLLHRILNRFFGSPMPHHWLGSHIWLLYKPGDPYQATNYRPIALLTTV